MEKEITSILRVLADLAFEKVSKDTQRSDYRNSMSRVNSFWQCYQYILEIYGINEIPDNIEWSKFVSLFAGISKEEAFRNLSYLSYEKKDEVQTMIKYLLDESILFLGNPQLFMSCSYLYESDKVIVHEILKKLNISKSELY